MSFGERICKVWCGIVSVAAFLFFVSSVFLCNKMKVMGVSLFEYHHLLSILRGCHNDTKIRMTGILLGAGCFVQGVIRALMALSPSPTTLTNDITIGMYHRTWLMVLVDGMLLLLLLLNFLLPLVREGGDLSWSPIIIIIIVVTMTLISDTNILLGINKTFDANKRLKKQKQE